MVELSVVLPAFNESALIGVSLDRLTRYLDEVPARPAPWSSWEVIVVDDGSTDGTGDAARAASRRDPRVQVISHPRNGGKGAATRSGIARARGAWIVVTDADLSYALDDIARTVSVLRGDGPGSGFDMVTGDRRHPDSLVELPPTAAARRVGRRQVLSRAFNSFVRSVFGVSWGDTQCGLKGFRHDAAGSIMERVRTTGFLTDVEMFLIAGRLGLRIATIPVRLTYLSDASTVNVARLVPRVIADAVRIRLAQALGRYGRR